jgi:hypothetical protein
VLGGVPAEVLAPQPLTQPIRRAAHIAPQRRVRSARIVHRIGGVARVLKALAAAQAIRPRSDP